ncbi:MAG: hypothetical protein MUE73_19120 [Planctomycetes bacterium]|jgi:hypothetical protein|nr:hypothetical protein [Planctomycetota bacterium]
MRTTIPAVLFLVLLLVPACETPPLPMEDIPQDFLFTYTFERAGSGTPTGETTPRRIHLALDVAGAVHYEVDHLVPAPASNTGEFRLDFNAMRAFYDSLRATDLFGLSESYEGTDIGFGTRTFFVIGRNTPKTVTVTNAPMALLDSLEKQFLALLPAEVLAYPKNAGQSIVLDLRSNTFHLGSCDEVLTIPQESRRMFGNPWDALNAGCRPAACCDPIENFR